MRIDNADLYGIVFLLTFFAGLVCAVFNHYVFAFCSWIVCVVTFVLAVRNMAVEGGNDATN